MRTETMKTTTISLFPQQVESLHDAVESGAYASDREVVGDALSLAENRRLMTAYDEGKASGDGRKIDAKTLLAELKAEARSGAKFDE